MPGRASDRVRAMLHRIVPEHFGDPIGLARRVWATGGAEGRFALLLAGLGLIATPWDLLLSPLERRRYARAYAPHRPILLVCGPPRSGTTVLAQVLINALPVSYFTNVTSLFPRAPITASSLLRARPGSGRPASTISHYGRTAGFLGVNDALYLWDRWLGSDRTASHVEIDDETGADMRRFFGAWEAWTGRPLVAKNNSLNTHAAEVARHLPTARFICLERDPRYLAQSLLVAREYIHGDRAASYGIAPDADGFVDPIASVIAQVRFHRQMARQQQDALGPERFRIVRYEDFCADPVRVVRHIAADAGLAVAEGNLPQALVASASQRLPDAEFSRLAAAWGDG